MVTPSLFNLYQRAEDTISYFEKDDLLEYLDELMTHPDVDDLSLLDRIHQFYLKMISDILLSYTIQVDEDTSLQDMLNIIDALVYLEDNENHEEICTLIENNEDIYSTLSSLLALSSVYDEVYYLELITDINPLLLARIYQEHNKQLSFEDNDTINHNPNKLKTIKSLKDNPIYNNTFVFNLIRNNIVFDLSLERYINLFKDNLFNEDDKETLAINLYLLSIIASDVSPIQSYQQILPLYLDMTLLTDIYTLIRTHPKESKHG